jgi:hypothetical protein
MNAPLIEKEAESDSGRVPVQVDELQILADRRRELSRSEWRRTHGRSPTSTVTRLLGMLIHFALQYLARVASGR